jgi:membrane-bound metal-dependent hydrolase YbcI (DUF457 family)
MTGKTHVAIAMAATLAYGAAHGQPPNAAGWLAVVIGSLAPDIDSGGGTIARPGSLLGRLVPRWLAGLLDALGLAVSGFIRRMLGHRNATHWPVWAVIMMLLAHNLGYGWLWWFGWGYGWHIAGDFCTKSGVPLLGPVFTWDIKWSPLKTGTWAEGVLSAALWGLIFYYGWTYLPPEAQYWATRFGWMVKSMLMEAL